MFEKEIKFIIDFTLNRIKRLGSFFTFEKLASAEIHPAIILYISAQLELLIYEDRKKLLQNSSFDYSGSEISKYFNLISEEIKKNKRLAFEDVKTLVSHAVTFNINYLVRPNWTLSKLIFDETKTRNVNEIKMMLNYLYYYDYVRNVFLGYFSKRKIISLSETEFESILNKVDKQMFGEHTRDLIDNALVSIGDFFNEGGLNKTRITTQTVEVFLKEKNLIEELFKLRRLITAEDKSKYDIEELRKILYSKDPFTLVAEEEVEDEVVEEKLETLSEETEENPDSEEGLDNNQKIEDTNLDENQAVEDFEKIEEEEVVFEEEDSLEKKEEEIIETTSPNDFLSRYESELKTLEELETQLSEPDSEEEIAFDEPEMEDSEVKVNENEETLTFEEIMTAESREKGEIEEERKEEREDEKEDESEMEFSDKIIFEEEEVNPFETVKEEVETPLAEKKNKDILSFINDKEMERIVSNVFNEDEEDFVNTMEKISDSPTYEDATEILKLVFVSYKINPYSKDAVVLTNAVSNFFNQE